MSKAYLTSFGLLWYGVLWVGGGSAQVTPDDSVPPAAEVPEVSEAPQTPRSETTQPIFTRIELSTEGVTATDSTGQRWYYNFNTESFVEARNEAQPETALRDPDRAGEPAAPVVERCTELLTVDRPSLKAVYVGYDEYVDGDIVAFSRVTIKGWVKGDVQSFNKRVLVTASGQVDGDIRAPEIEVKPGGVVLGREIKTAPLATVPDYISTQFSAIGIWIVLAFTVVLALLVFLSASLAPRHMERVVDCLIRYRIRCFFLGLVLFFLLPVILLLVAITVVGIVVLPLVPFALLAALAYGMTAVARPVVGLVIHRDLGGQQALLAQSLFAVIAYMALWAVVAVLLGANGPNADVYQGFGIALLVIAIVTTLYPFLSGLGAAALTRFGYRDYISFRERRVPEERRATAPAPPPMPETPLRPRPFIPPPPRSGNPPDKLRPPSEGQ